ncbi:MAG: hypothetical protein JWO94_3227 [Verrucomicrobiaceae bacterium]|nr:hypothetical protein [Verrucomicrobiaceae bacterium]
MTLPALFHTRQGQTACLALAALSLALTGCQLPAEHTAEGGAPGSGQPTVRRALAINEGEELYQPVASLNLPSQAAPLNDTARLLAGLPPGGQDYFPQIRNSTAWTNHQAKLDSLWHDFNWRHEAPIHAWAASQIADLQASPAVFYPFSGPDFLFANTFFPHSDTVVLCGLESCEALPPLSQLSPPEMDASLSGLDTSLSTAIQFSFFITKDMRRDLATTRFKGVLPVILTFMARTGHTVDSVDLVRLDANGQPVIVNNAGGEAPGLLIRGYGPTGRVKRVFYFRQDLSDGGLHSGSPLLKFVSSLGSPPAFVKSASYLMHQEGFHTIRDYLLTRCRGIVQDPSGVPYRNMLAAGADVRLYGNYQGTLDMFKEHQQPDLIAAYQQGHAPQLSFGVGYLFHAASTCLMVERPGVRVSTR